MSSRVLLAGKEGDGVGFQSPDVTGGEFFDHMGYARELIARESVRNDQNSAMRSLLRLPTALGSNKSRFFRLFSSL